MQTLLAKLYYDLEKLNLQDRCFRMKCKQCVDLDHYDEDIYLLDFVSYAVIHALTSGHTLDISVFESMDDVDPIVETEIRGDKYWSKDSSLKAKE
jgi:dihydroorotase-like cyclic amidohydrolase